jgi:Zn-finger nucleic acid-binding protein
MLRFLARFVLWCALVLVGGALGVAVWNFASQQATHGSLGAAILLLLSGVVWPVLLLSRGWKLAGRVEEILAGVQRKGPPAPPPPMQKTRLRRRRQAALFVAIVAAGIWGLARLAGFSLTEVLGILGTVLLQMFKDPLGGVVACVLGLMGWGTWSFCGRVTSETLPDVEESPPPPAVNVPVVGGCPRCASQVLARGTGSLNEDTCPGCAGHFLPPDAAHTLLVDHLGLSPAMLKELMAHFAGTRLNCPSCAARMSPVTLKGVHADLCGTCGGVWLDRGELHRVSGGRFEEVGAGPGKA